jgi:hypothetical protein
MFAAEHAIGHMSLLNCYEYASGMVIIIADQTSVVASHLLITTYKNGCNIP